MMDCFQSCAVCFLLAASDGEMELKRERQRCLLSGSPGLEQAAQGKRKSREQAVGMQLRESPEPAEGHGLATAQ